MEKSQAKGMGTSTARHHQGGTGQAHCITEIIVQADTLEEKTNEQRKELAAVESLNEDAVSNGNDNVTFNSLNTINSKYFWEEESEDDSSITSESHENPGKRNYGRTWSHFERTPEGGVCCYCGKLIKIKGHSTWNLARHIRSVHAGIKMTTTAGPAPCANGTSSASTTPTNASVALSNHNAQSSHVDCLESLTVLNQEKLHRLLMLSLINDCNPFIMIEGSYLKDFVSNLNQQYIMPTKEYLTNELLPRVYNETVGKVLFKLSKVEWISLTIEDWKNFKNLNLKAISAHFIDKQYKHSSYLLECSVFMDSLTVAEITEWIKKVINKFALRGKVVSITSNNPNDVTSVCLQLGSQNYSCFAHCLNAVVENAITESVKQTYAKVKQIIFNINQCADASKRHAEMQKSFEIEKTKLKIGNLACWHATYAMINRFWQNRNPVTVCINSLRLGSTLQPNDWSIVEQSVQVLGYFDEAVKHLSTNALITLSKMGLIIRLLEQKLAEFQRDTENMSPDVQDMVMRLISGMSDELKTLKNDEHVLQAMILDPRIKRQGFDKDLEHFQSASEVIIKAIMPMYDEPPSSDSKQCKVSANSIFLNFTKGRPAAWAELDRYLRADTLALDQDPLLWWYKEKNNYPKLYDLVHKRFCIPATAISCDRMYTKAGRLYTVKRNNLGAKNIHLILFIQQNYGKG